MDAELYFLMANFLAAGPCRRAADALQAEIGELGLLPGTDALSSMRRRHSCPPDQLRRLLRRLLELEKTAPDRANHGGATGGGGGAERSSLLTIVGVTERKTPRALAVSQYVRQRELCGRAPRPLRDSSAAALQVGADRFGLRGVFEGHASAAYCVIFDATGERVFTGADDGLVKAWGARSCLLLRTLRGHRSEVTDLTAHPNGKLLASASNDRTVRIWRVDGNNAAMPCIAVLETQDAASGLGTFVVSSSWRPLDVASAPPQLLSIGSAGWSEWASWRRHSWPPEAHESAFEGLGLLYAIGTRGPAPQIAPSGLDSDAKPRPRCRFRCV